LGAHGWRLAAISGSHHIFRGEERRQIVIPVHRNRVKPAYQRLVDQAIEEVARGGGGA
jgi:predicted RNA binding protein YcfA (HicA-like mRNA interferase family)